MYSISYWKLRVSIFLGETAILNPTEAVDMCDLYGLQKTLQR